MARKKYSSEEKYRYHNSRVGSAAKHGIKFGDPKHSYSCGFTDGFHGINNTRALKRELGKKSGNAYAIGQRRGEAAAHEYFMRTGNQPGDLR